MQSSRFVPVSALALLAALAAAPAAAQAAHAAHAAHATHAPTAATPAQRWATDASLRDGMRRIRQATQALEHYEHGHMDAVQARNVATLIDAAVNDMLANCKLKPDADAALHGLLAKFLAGAKALRESRETPAAIAGMRAALVRYPQLFDDPEWNAKAD